MNKLFRRQVGFTLLELVVVIIILGILAVIAAPKFINLKSDAVKADMSELEGSIKSTNSLVFSKAVIQGKEKAVSGQVDVNGKTVSTKMGYIKTIPNNLTKVLEGSFVALKTGKEDFGEDWGIYASNSVSNVLIIPHGYTASSDCHLSYDVEEKTKEHAHYVLVTSGC